jgi:predicted metal-dependent phosphoesterase TrpH
MQVKANLHLHTGDDPKDSISYSPFEAIDKAAELGIDVLAFTCHEKFTHKKECEDYARDKGIFLISGIETRIEGKDTIILNCDEKIEQIKTFKDLEKYKNLRPHIFVLAPHPFVPHSDKASLGAKWIENIDLYDAVELSVFSNKILNFNKKMRKLAEKYKQPIIATGDTHFLKDMDRGYAIIETKEKTPQAIFEAIRQKNFKNHSRPMGLTAMFFFIAKMDETEEIRRLLEKNLAATQDVLKIAKSLQRTNKLARWWKITKWVVIIGLSLGAYYYIQPYIQTFWQSIDSIRTDFSSTHNSIKNLGNLMP